MKKYENDIVSVILPVYNSEKYLKKTFKSILSQTYENLEIIVINDCSTDNSLDIIEYFQKKDDRVKVINLKENSGVAIARNKGISVSTGRFIAFIDSDDMWHGTKIQQQISRLIKDMNGFSYTGIEIINSEDIVIKKKRKVKKEVDYNYLLKNTIIATSSVVLDRKYVNDISMPLLRSGQDYATWLSILRNGIIAIGIDKPLVKYRQTNNSLSKNKFKSVKQVWFIQKKYEKIGFFKRIINTILFVFNATVKKIF